MTAIFGDTEPEDAYDASDPPHIRLLIIARIVEALADDPDLSRRARRRVNVVRLLRNVTQDVADG